MSELADKERRAIKILRMYRGDDPIEVSYSGGKDSDVILALTKMAGIPYRAIYKNTTIDPPGTVQHCKDNGVEWLEILKLLSVSLVAFVVGTAFVLNVERLVRWIFDDYI
jgi:3'-phosphoadenosine 5'-phosphosulfate sulfotransferase (PAPS reductase)/FAD synthetase